MASLSFFAASAALCHLLIFKGWSSSVSRPHRNILKDTLTSFKGHIFFIWKLLYESKKIPAKQWIISCPWENVCHVAQVLPADTGLLSTSLWNNSLHWWGEEKLQRANTEAGIADTGAIPFVIIPLGPSKPGWQDLTHSPLTSLCAVIMAACSLQDTLTPAVFYIPCCGRRFMPPHCFTNS